VTGQPVGKAVPGWTPRATPDRATLVGSSCRLEQLDPDRHAEPLFAADRLDARGESWTYLSYGPFADLAAYRKWVEQVSSREDPRFYAILDAAGVAVGVASLLRIDPEMGSMEVGHLHFSPALQRSRAATEAQYLLMRHAFDDLGYRRYEWKCDALNAPSRAAAERLGFRHEGVFRQAAVVKGRNRDTAWYSIVDTEWPAVRERLTTWLASENFDAQGRQRRSLRP
jgi:RimJ/RimL family protein N-acetyltransferase